jgi:hypothetical protein
MLLTCGRYLPGRSISLKGKIWAHALFYDFDILFWNCSDRVVFVFCLLCFHAIYNCIVDPNLHAKIKIKCSIMHGLTPVHVK